MHTFLIGKCSHAEEVDAETRAKAIRLVQEPAGDYASVYATVVRKQRWWDGRPDSGGRVTRHSTNVKKVEGPPGRRVAAPRAMFMRCSPFRLLPGRPLGHVRQRQDCPWTAR
jgi:hypothetical protein